MIIRRVFRRLVRPISRPAALLLLWSHRRTLALWIRSIRSELERGRKEGHDAKRWKTLVAALWRVSGETTLLQENELRRLVVADDDQHIVASVGTDTLEAATFTHSRLDPVTGYV